MVSNHCSIDEFVDAVKDKTPLEVITIAAEEATCADRIALKTHDQTEPELNDSKIYSLQLKRLIDYHRLDVKPHRPLDKVYRQYMIHWGE